MVHPKSQNILGCHMVGESTTSAAPTSNENAGIAFTFMNAGNSTVCIDNVTLAAAN